MALKAGSITNFEGSMAAAMEQALGEEYQIAKQAPLPATGEEDRRLLFVAIARGVLEYLKAHEDEILTSITLEDLTGTGSEQAQAVLQLELNL